jgi:hypothetical protein
VEIVGGGIGGAVAANALLQLGAPRFNAQGLGVGEGLGPGLGLPLSDHSQIAYKIAAESEELANIKVYLPRAFHVCCRLRIVVTAPFIVLGS